MEIMILEDILLKRCESKCELCKSAQSLKLYEVPPQSNSNEENCIMICDKCLDFGSNMYCSSFSKYNKNNFAKFQNSISMSI